MSNNNSSIKRVAVNASVFIIPNGAPLVSAYIINQDNIEKNMKKLCELNGETFDPEKDHVVECWFHSKELNCDNMCDHFFRLTIDGKEYHTRLQFFRMFPETLLRGCTEGSTKEFIYPLILLNEEDETKLDCELVMNVTFDQTHYRYRHTGNFEDTLAMVCR